MEIHIKAFFCHVNPLRLDLTIWSNTRNYFFGCVCPFCGIRYCFIRNCCNRLKLARNFTLSGNFYEKKTCLEFFSSWYRETIKAYWHCRRCSDELKYYRGRGLGWKEPTESQNVHEIMMIRGFFLAYHSFVSLFKKLTACSKIGTVGCDTF